MNLSKVHTLWVAGIGCTSLLAFCVNSKSLRGNESNELKHELDQEAQAATHGRHLVMDVGEYEALLAEEDIEAEANAVDDVFVETEEVNGLQGEIDTITEMMAAATDTCTEDMSADDFVPTADEVDEMEFDSLPAEIPCADSAEMAELELQMSDVWGQLEHFLEEEIDESELDGLLLDSSYDAFKKEFHKEPFSSAAEELEHKTNFQQNILKIKAQNEVSATGVVGENRALSSDQGWEAKITEFSDMSEEEFESIMAFEQNQANFAEELDHHERRGLLVEIPEDSTLDGRHLQEAFSWVGSGHLGRVVNQGSCGSCYLNAVVTEFETALAISMNNAPLALSREQIKNCQKENFKTLTSTPRGCNGGWMSKSYEYIRRNWLAAEQREGSQGITLESVYPYVPKNKVCAHNPGNMVARAKVGRPEIAKDSYIYISPSEANFKKALIKGPIVVALGASGWGSYGSGVMTCGALQYSINHAVTLVGWGEENGVKYWLIQNSWGTWWGEGGFIKIRRGLNADGSESTGRGRRGDIGCGMTVYGGYQSKLPTKVDSNVQDCAYEWSDWSPCTDLCEGGVRTRSVIHTTTAANGGLACPYPHGYKQTKDCEYNVIKSNPEWTACDAACSGGKQTKSTYVLKSDGSQCPSKTEDRSCNNHICPEHCLIVTDGPYSMINGNYHPSTGPNTRDKCSTDVPIYSNDKNSMKLFWYATNCNYGYWVMHKSVGNRGYMWSRKAKPTGTSPLAIDRWWNDRNDMKLRALPCNELPVDCEVAWNKEWSGCDKDCDSGTQTKSYKIIKDQANGGRACPSIKTRTCNTFSCGQKCVKVSNARYRFLNGVYNGVQGGYTHTWCGGDTLPRYTKTRIRKTWWRTYKYTDDLVFSNSRCRYRRSGNPRYQVVGGKWNIGRLYNRYGRTFVGAYDRSPYSWSRYIKPSDANHPSVMGWESSAMAADEWRKAPTTIEEVPCTN